MWGDMKHEGTWDMRGHETWWDMRLASESLTLLGRWDGGGTCLSVWLLSMQVDGGEGSIQSMLASKHSSSMEMVLPLHSCLMPPQLSPFPCPPSLISQVETRDDCGYHGP